MTRRVVITAAAAITPIGHFKEDIIKHLVEGISGVKKLRSDNLLTDYIHSGVYGTVDYPVEYDFKRHHRKTMGPVSYYACQVAKEVLEASGLDADFITSGRLGWPLGQRMAALQCSGRSTGCFSATHHPVTHRSARWII